MASGPIVWLTPFHVAEWTQAVEQQVFRRAASRTEADHSHERFQQHREGGLWVEIAVPESAFEVCAQLGRRYGAPLGLRTLYTLHVASALELKAERFWSFDERQKKLARAVGLKTA
jgi:predicted nucleic acid-binding protein